MRTYVSTKTYTIEIHYRTIVLECIRSYWTVLYGAIVQVLDSSDVIVHYNTPKIIFLYVSNETFKTGTEKDSNC